MLEQQDGIEMGEDGQERPLVASPSKLRVDAPSFRPVMLLAFHLLDTNRHIQLLAQLIGLVKSIAFSALFMPSSTD